MKKLASICTGLLFFLSTSVFAEQHAVGALEHTKAAVVQGKSGHTMALVEQAKAALEDVLEATLVAKGLVKNHLDAGSKELQEAIDHGNMGHVGVATHHAEAALQHIKAANK